MHHLDPKPQSRKPPSVGRHRFAVTFFKDQTGRTLESRKLNLPDMQALVLETKRSTKAKLPWWKMATFGDVRTEKNCLRHDGNVLEITGIELDYDKEQMSFDEAVEILIAMNVRCIIYTSPSHTKTAPRLRVMLPTSRPFPTSFRTRFVARVNNEFEGVFATESFTLSQSYYFGKARDNPAPDHRAEVIDGRFLDDLMGEPAIDPDADNITISGGDGDNVTVKPVKTEKNPFQLFAEELGAVADEPRGFTEHIARVGDGESLGGFNDPLTRSASAYASENGADFSRAELKRIFRNAIDAAPKKATRNPADIKRYRSDTYLDGIINSAVRKFAGVEDTTAAAGSETIKAQLFTLRDPKLIPKREWLYGRHLIRKFGSATVANGGVGKTNLLIVEALAMVTGRTLLGISPQKRLRTWIWNGEDPMEELERRIAAACLLYRITAKDIGGRLFINSGRDCEIIIATQTRDGAKIAKPVVDALQRTIEANGIDVVMIDPFVASHRVTENDNNAIELVAKQWTKLADTTNTAIDLAHHVRKLGGVEATVEDARGAGALLNAVRASRVLNSMSEHEADKGGVENRRTYFKIGDGKMNLAPPSDEATWHHIKSVDLGNGAFHGEGDNVGVVTQWSWPDPLDGVDDIVLAAVLTAVRNGAWRENVQAKDWIGHAIAEATGLDVFDKKDKARISGLLKAWLKNGLLVRVSHVDEKRRETKVFVEVADGY